MSFTLDSRLQDDCHYLGCTGAGHLLLHRNAALPWFILVPEVAETEICEIPSDKRLQIYAEVDELALLVKRHFQCDKLNVAAIGNVVRQLHIHVVARWRSDACWPAPVWGNLTEGKGYGPPQLAEIKALVAPLML